MNNYAPAWTCFDCGAPYTAEEYLREHERERKHGRHRDMPERVSARRRDKVPDRVIPDDLKDVYENGSHDPVEMAALVHELIERVARLAAGEGVPARRRESRAR